MFADAARPFGEFVHRLFHSAACFGQRSLSGAGLVVQASQIGASQVPDFRDFTFQSQSSAAGLPQPMHRFRAPLVQTMALAPFGSWGAKWQVTYQPPSR
jgi:hypothetical protein